MPDAIQEVLVSVAKGLEIVGAAALVLGFVVASVQCIRRLRERGPQEAYERYRQSLGRTVLVGLEILVAATIIKTLTVDPTPAGLGLLALMIGIRTILGWSMVLELEGRWPWQKRPAEEAPKP